MGRVKEHYYNDLVGLSNQKIEEGALPIGHKQWTQLGEIEVMGFIDFLEKHVSVKEACGDTDQVNFNQCDLEQVISYREDDVLEEQVATFNTVVIDIDKDKLEDLIIEVYKNATFEELNKQPVEYLVEEIAVQYAMAGSYDITYILEIAPNRYTPATRQDFTVYKNKDGKMGLAIRSKPLCIVFDISKFDNSIYKVEDEK